jgi:hypothetical protein
MRTATIVLVALVGSTSTVSTECETSPKPPAATPAAPAGPPAATSAVVGPPQVPWASLNDEQKKTFMKAVVFPKMRDVFQAFDAKRYANFNCTTCHGDGAADGSFKMPNARLPKLPATPEGFAKLAAEKPTATEFMMKQVKPAMAVLLGMPEFTPQNQSGFGCMHCHTK